MSASVPYMCVCGEPRRRPDPDPAAGPLDPLGEADVLDDLAADALDAADPVVRRPPDQHEGAVRQRLGPLRVVDPAERVEHREDLDQGQGDRPLPEGLAAGPAEERDEVGPVVGRLVPGGRQGPRVEPDVGVDHPEPVGLGRLDPLVQRPGLADPAGRPLDARQQPDRVGVRVEAGLEPADDLGGVVGRLVVDDQDRQMGIVLRHQVTGASPRCAPARCGPGRRRRPSAPSGPTRRSVGRRNRDHRAFDDAEHRQGRPAGRHGGGDHEEGRRHRRSTPLSSGTRRAGRGPGTAGRPRSRGEPAGGDLAALHGHRQPGARLDAAADEVEPRDVGPVVQRPEAAAEDVMLAAQAVDRPPEGVEPPGERRGARHPARRRSSAREPRHPRPLQPGDQAGPHTAARSRGRAPRPRPASAGRR